MAQMDEPSAPPLLLLFVCLFAVFMLYSICAFIFCPTPQQLNNDHRNTASLAKKNDEAVENAIEEVILSPEMRKLQGRLFPKATKTSTKPNLTLSIDKAFIDRNCDHAAIQNLDTTAEQLNEIAVVYILIHAESDEEQETILETMKSHYLPSFKQYHRILFYGSEIGKIAMLRQLKPKIHVEHDNSTYTAIKPHIDRTVLLEQADRGGKYNTGKEVGKYEDTLYLDFRSA